MSELLKALQGLPERTEKKHFVTIDGKKLQVPLKKKLEIQQHGEEKPAKFGPEIVLRPKPKKKTRFPVLQKAEKGYTFEDNDIHWPNGVAEGGETWLIEYE